LFGKAGQTEAMLRWKVIVHDWEDWSPSGFAWWKDIFKVLAPSEG